MDLLEDRLKQDTPPEIIQVPYTGHSFEEPFEQFKYGLSEQTKRLGFWIRFEKGKLPNEIHMAADGYVYHFDEMVDDKELIVLMNACRRHSATLVLSSPSIDGLIQGLARLRSGRISIVAAVEISDSVHGTRRLIDHLASANDKVPVLLSSREPTPGLATAAVLGSLICDGIGDAVSVSASPLSRETLDFSYNLLQACGSRITKTEYVSCPSCGRTLFDLQSTTERIKSKTGHLKGVKIAIMGCIVNGPGEMADADFGYVGGGPGKINLYVGKTCVQKSIPSDIADEKLIELIKSHGKWAEPPVPVA
jgi:hypothetical protein